MHAKTNLQDGLSPVRDMEITDIPMVYAIEEVCHDLDGWPEKLFNDCLNAGFPSFVIDFDDCVCGFVIASIGADEMQILNIKVAPESRQQGIASLLLAECINLAQRRECYKITLEVRLSNTPAQHLYEKFNFIRDGYRKEYYSAENGTREDALLYSLHLREFDSI